MPHSVQHRIVLTTVELLRRRRVVYLDFEERYGRAMLTIRAMTGGAGYSQRHLEHSDYYDEHRHAQGEWRGVAQSYLRNDVTCQFLIEKTIAAVLPA